MALGCGGWVLRCLVIWVVGWGWECMLVALGLLDDLGGGCVVVLGHTTFGPPRGRESEPRRRKWNRIDATSRHAQGC